MRATPEMVLAGRGPMLPWMVTIPGKPITKGSLDPVKTRDGRGHVVVKIMDKPEARKWKQGAIGVIRRQEGITPLLSPARSIIGFDPAPWSGPVAVHFTAYFEKLCVPDRSMRFPTREGGTYAHGDSDKLERNLWDALVQAGVIEDDSNVVQHSGSKVWAEPGTGARMEVQAWPIES